MKPANCCYDKINKTTRHLSCRNRMFQSMKKNLWSSG